jgi:hypothetical protein
MKGFYGIIFPYGGTYQMLPALSREKAWTKKLEAWEGYFGVRG